MNLSKINFDLALRPVADELLHFAYLFRVVDNDDHFHCDFIYRNLSKIVNLYLFKGFLFISINVFL